MLRKKRARLLLSRCYWLLRCRFSAYAEEVSQNNRIRELPLRPRYELQLAGDIASGTTITVTDTSNSEWYAVRLSNGSTGYIYAEYISMSTGGSNKQWGRTQCQNDGICEFPLRPGHKLQL